MAKELKISRIIVDILKKIASYLEKNKISYAVIGGVALQAWGRERSTKDIDITIALNEGGERNFLGHLARLGLEIIKSHKINGDCVLIETEYLPPELGLPIEVDFFIAKTEYHKEVLKRATAVDVLGNRFRLMSPEDLILSKLLSNRPLDLSDVRGILAEQRVSLDEAYIFLWARRLGVSRRLASLIKEVGS